jgi:hypothetical protein
MNVHGDDGLLNPALKIHAIFFMSGSRGSIATNGDTNAEKLHIQ